MFFTQQRYFVNLELQGGRKMLRRPQSAEIAYPQMAVVPATTADLLLVNFDGPEPVDPNRDQFAAEVMDGEATDYALASLSHSGRIVSLTQAKYIAQELAWLRENNGENDEVGGNNKRFETLMAAQQRHKTARELIHRAGIIYHGDYTVDHIGTDEAGTTRRPIPDKVKALDTATRPFETELPLSVILAMRKYNGYGFIEAERLKAERYLRILYDGQVQVNAVSSAA